MGAIKYLILFIPLVAHATYYTTQWKYQNTQDPLYEGNNWVNGKSGINWSNVQSFNGMVSGRGGHDTSDSAALLTGTWGNDQDVSMTFYKAASIDATHFAEIEILLRGTISGSSGGTFKTYECFWSVDDLEHCFITRWNGAAGSFDSLLDCGAHHISNGDVLRATIVGQTITMYINGVSIGSVTDNSASKITSGNPGLGFDSNLSSYDYSTWGCSNYTASDGVWETQVNHTAVSCALSNVQASLNWCVNTDTNSIPAGNASWANNLVITQAIILAGAGTNSTFITNNLTSDWMIQINIPPAGTNFLTGICFAPGNSNSIYNCVYVQGSNDVRRFRAYYNKFYLSPGAFKFDTVFGVVDHNYFFNNAPGNKVAHVKDSVYNGLASGNGVWTNTEANLAGTDQAIFFEDNVVTSTNTTFVMSAIDSQAGALYVYRYNRNTNSYVEAHGSEASYERSSRLGIVHNNFFDMANVNQYICLWRGGVLLIFSNSVNNCLSSGCIKCEDNRMNNANLFGPFNGADGRNHWDKNSVSNPFATGTVQSFSANPNIVTVSGTPYTPSQYIGYTITKTSGKAVTSVTQSGGLITVVCTGHGFSDGDQVSIYGANQQEYNYMARITFVDANTFTQGPFNWLPTSPATGTIKCCKGGYFAEINANGNNTITYNAGLYGVGYDMTFAANDTFQINLVTQPMDGMGIVGGSLIPSTLTPAFPGSWNDQTIYGSYQWSNNTGNITGIAFSSSSATIAVGTHIFNDTQAPGYTPYLYPHYLVSGVGPVAPNTTSMVFQGVKLQGISVPSQ